MTDSTPGLQQVLGELGNELFPDATPIGQRYPVTRTGPREPLRADLRWLIWHRDNGTCKLCGASDRTIEIDHVVPWSAGGTDHSSNLRALCQPCNQARSNYRLLEAPRLRPVTALCDRCFVAHNSRIALNRRHDTYAAMCPICRGDNPPYPEDPDQPGVPAFCGCCKSMSIVTDPGRLM